MEERLQKIIARAGIASRRRAEDLILAGQVTVNGKVVKELGTRADAARDHIKVAGRLLRGAPEAAYVILHKPSGCVSALSDPDGRPTVKAYLRTVPARVFPVGVLDYHTQGLLLLTNDGELANRLMREPGRLPQTYWLKLKGRLTSQTSAAIEQAGRFRLRLIRPGDNPWYEVRLSSRPGQSPGEALEALRALLVEQGHPMEKQRRVTYGPLDLGNLEPGEFRFLEKAEAKQLREAAGLDYKGAAPADVEKQPPARSSGGRRKEESPRRSAADTRGGRYAGRRR